MSDKPEVTLSSQPDGYGFYYGQVISDGELLSNVNVLPPENLWAGDFKLEGYEPHVTQWIVYADGEEIARLEKREDLEEVLTPLLT